MTALNSAYTAILPPTTVDGYHAHQSAAVITTG